ncbi:MAG: NADH-quinone oxidoreductase subunit NuoN [Luteitalea sp.]|nr:NADH-quinone oxidoreductase subunit NuoN [Luteitalea sp.]
MLTDFQAIMPILIVTLSAIVTMVAEAFQPKQERAPLAGFGVIGLIGAAAASVLLWGYDKTGFGVVRADNFSLFVNLIVIAVGLLTILFSPQVIERERIPPGEYYALTLFAVVGMMLMAAATDLLLLFLALEVLSLAVYVLTGIRRAQFQSAEAAFKYFLLGAFSSAFFLYGVALTYAIVGSTRLEEIAATLAVSDQAPDGLVLVAMGLLAVGFAFKISAVPFHMWAPDAYQGAPTLVTGFMATGVKAAAFAAFLRVFLSSFHTLHDSWAPMLWLVAVATMILGTVVGVVQANAKRMLAYSSVAHAGYLLVGLIVGTRVGEAATLFYLAAYAVSTLGAFAVVAVLATEEHPHDRVQDFAGLWESRPGLAALMTVFLLSLGGFPPLAGFVGKWYIFSAAIDAGYVWLAIVGVLTSVISVFFYLRIVVMMYMSDERALVPTPAITRSAVAGLTLALVAVFYLGLLPTHAIELALTSVQGMF